MFTSVFEIILPYHLCKGTNFQKNHLNYDNKNYRDNFLIEIFAYLFLTIKDEHKE